MNFNNNQTVQSLYVHWPFCPYKCHFCPFVALAGHDQFMERYHIALKKEIQSFAKNTQKTPLKTIFLGGGTPSTYPLNLLLDTFDTIYKEFVCDLQIEVSMEVNPGTVSEEKLIQWKKLGINRLSIGVQSLNDNVLKKLNRHQSVSDVEELMTMATPLFDNISIDLIVGLPGISCDEWKKMIETIVQWPINHVSMYFLTVHEDTPLYFGVKQQKIILPSDDAIVDLYYWTIEYFSRYGLYQYEVSNFGRENYESRHNSVYWQRKPYKGFGLGACSFDGQARFQNEKSLMKYLEGIEQDKNITIFCEQLTEEQAWLEMLMLGLRQSKGVLLKDITQPLSEQQKKLFFESVSILCQAKLLDYKKTGEHEFIVLTPKGLSVVNEVVVKLFCF